MAIIAVERGLCMRDIYCTKACLDKFGGKRFRALNQLATRMWKSCIQKRIHLSTLSFPRMFNPAP